METVCYIKRISREITHGPNISGSSDVRYLAEDNDVKVIECNPRASRLFPFISKVLKTNFIGLTTEMMLKIPV